MAFILAGIYLYNDSVIRERQEVVVNNLGIALEPLVRRFDLTDIQHVLYSVSSASQMQAVELIDFYGIAYSSIPDISKLGAEDQRIEINGSMGEVGYVRVWWDSSQSGQLIFYAISGSIMLQICAAYLLGWFGLRRYIVRLIANPLADLEARLISYSHDADSTAVVDFGAIELNALYDTFTSVQHRLYAENLAKRLVLENLEIEQSGRVALITDFSNVMSLANCFIKYFPSDAVDNPVQIGQKIPTDLSVLLSQPNISVNEIREYSADKNWQIKAVDLEAVLGHGAVSGTFHIEIYFGDGVCWSLVAVPNSGKGSAYLCMDISGQKILEKQERDTRHLKALGVLTSGVAHDINNILAIVMASIEANGLTQALRERDELALDAIVRGKNLVSQLLDSSRGIERTIVAVDVSQVLENLKKVFNSANYPDIQFEFKDCLVGVISAEEGLIESTLSNLIINSCQSMGMSGQVTICARQSLAEDLGGLDLPGDVMYSTIEVTDEGPGVPDAVLDQIFDPFFTTKTQSQGTGLGLSMARGFAQRSGGDIFYRHGSMSGAEFGILLPIMQVSPLLQPERNPVEEQSISFSRHRMLLVDDEQMLLSVMSQLLGYLDVEVVTAENCQAAFDLMEEQQFDWLISDMYMPDGEGLLVLERMKKLHPDAKRILMSGNLHKSDLRPDELELVDEVLKKPFSLEAVKKVMVELSDHSPVANVRTG